MCIRVRGAVVGVFAGWDDVAETGRKSVEGREQDIQGGGIVFGVFAGCCRGKCLFRIPWRGQGWWSVVEEGGPGMRLFQGWLMQVTLLS